MQINDIEKMSTDVQFSLLKELIQKFKDKFQFNFQVNGSAFHTIYHEMGHVQDMQPRCLTTNKLNFEYAKYPDELKEWIGNQEYMQTANKVSGYSSSGPGEFIAETFAIINPALLIAERIVFQTAELVLLNSTVIHFPGFK